VTSLLALLVPIIIIEPTPTHPPIIYSDDVVIEATRPPIIVSDDIVIETCPEGFIWHYGCVEDAADKEERAFYRWLGIDY
jgi:hypothetical protein